MQTMKKPFNKYQQKQYERYAQACRVDLPSLIADRYSIKFSGNGNNLDAVGHGLRLGMKESNGERVWIANGTVVGNAVQAIQLLDKSHLNKVTLESEAINVIEVFSKNNFVSMFDKANLKDSVSTSMEFKLTDAHRDASGVIADYIKSRGIDWGTFNKAQEASFADKTSAGVRFLGNDATGQPKNAETRLVEPKILGDKLTKFICTPGSDRSYPPILPGTDPEVHIVEGGFSALGLKEILNRQGRSPTIIVSGGKDNTSWLRHDHIKAIIKDAVVVLHTENEKSAEIQAQAAIANDKQCQEILSIGALKVTKQLPPAQFKDNADINLHYKQQLQLQQQSKSRTR